MSIPGSRPNGYSHYEDKKGLFSHDVVPSYPLNLVGSWLLVIDHALINILTIDIMVNLISRAHNPLLMGVNI